MALFNRQKNSNVPLELQPYYDAPRSGPRGWLMWVVRILALLIVIGALIVGGRWGWQKIDNNDKKVGTSISQQGSKRKDTSSSSSSSSSKSSSNTNKSQASVTPKDDSSSTRSTSTPAPTSPAPASSSSSASNSNSSVPSTLVNTGPGDTIALFSVITIISALAFQAYLRLKHRVQS